ncbi:MAG: hypothetical protein MRQ09_05770 [Candidatus Midichloria sp.]|nr:hypothetical protein [Candidatus Midichloria sp.]
MPQYAEPISIETHSDVHKYEEITEPVQNTHESWELELDEIDDFSLHQYEPTSTS